MKRGLKFVILVLGIFVLFISMINGISAACSASNQTIMKLYNSNNSHGALWNDTVYTYDICYDSIFGSVYTGANPHSCSGTNTVLWLYQTNNSHASNPQITGYNTPVCYGDLVCKADTSAGSTCAEAEKIVVVRLYQINNSHISNAGFTSYPIKICCNKTGGVTPPTAPNAYWANTVGTPIVTALEGDAVLMILENSNLPAGSITFEIYENDTSTENSIRTVALGNAITGTVDSSGKANGTWIITQADLDRTLDFDRFVFKITGNRSNFLTVTPTGGPTTSFPICQIIGPQSWWLIGTDMIDSTNDCYRVNGFPGPECCPDNYYCGADSICHSVESCKDLPQAECDGNIGLAAGDLEGITTETCGEFYDQYDGPSSTCSWYLDCECKWNGTACLAAYKNKISNGSRLFTESELAAAGGGNLICGGTENRVSGECLYDISISVNCDEPGGEILRSWTVEWTGDLPIPGDCVDYNDVLECSSIVRISFFTWINIIAVVVILLVIYYLYAISDRKK